MAFKCFCSLLSYFNTSSILNYRLFRFSKDFLLLVCICVLSGAWSLYKAFLSASTGCGRHVYSIVQVGRPDHTPNFWGPQILGPLQAQMANSPITIGTACQLFSWLVRPASPSSTQSNRRWTPGSRSVETWEHQRAGRRLAADSPTGLLAEASRKRQ